MQDINNIVECLQRNSIEKPDEIAYEFVKDLSLTTEKIPYKQLHSDVCKIARNLLQRVAPGDCVLLLYPPSIDYIKAFFACLMAGVVAIPVYPPKKNSKSDKVFIVAQVSKAKYAITTEKELPPISAFWIENSNIEMSFLSTDELVNLPESDAYLPDIDSEKPAFLQYTSGSTGNPKGVIITQGNILANTKYLERLSGAHEQDVFVNWLPLFHDLGLVTTILLPAYLGCRSVLMAPATFVRNSVVWLKAITIYEGTIAGAPNFAYDMCTDKVSEADLLDLDLSKWRIAYNAAEPVSYETISRFSSRFSTVGFKLDSFYPSYGMAESTAFVTGGNGANNLSTISISRTSLAENKVIVLEDNNDNDKIDFVGNGFVDTEHHLKIVDSGTMKAKPEGEIGEVWFSGPSVSPGYWLLDDVSKETFGHSLSDDGRNYLKTGDLGFIVDKQLYITGRSKDMMILRGKNYYPQDIEATVKYCHDDIHAGYSAAFQVDGRLIVVSEIKKSALKSLDSGVVAQQIARSIYREHDISVDDIVLLSPYRIPMTSSGKIRRRKTKSLYQTGQLSSLYQKLQTQDNVEPKGEVEIAVHSIWSQVLGETSICVNRGFYELGGDSVKAIEIVTAIKNKYQSLQLDENEMLECSTISEMAKFVALSSLKNAQVTEVAGAVRI